MKTIVKPLPLPWERTDRTSSTKAIVSVHWAVSAQCTAIIDKKFYKQRQHTSYQLYFRQHVTVITNTTRQSVMANHQWVCLK